MELKPGPCCRKRKAKFNPVTCSTNTSFLKERMAIAFLSVPSTLMPLRCPAQEMKITPVKILQSFPTIVLLTRVWCFQCGNKRVVGVSWVTPLWPFSSAVPNAGSTSGAGPNRAASAYARSGAQPAQSPRFLPLPYPPPRSTSRPCWEPAAISLRPQRGETGERVRRHSSRSRAERLVLPS